MLLNYSVLLDDWLKTFASMNSDSFYVLLKFALNHVQIVRVRSDDSKLFVHSEFFVSTSVCFMIIEFQQRFLVNRFFLQGSLLRLIWLDLEIHNSALVFFEIVERIWVRIDCLLYFKTEGHLLFAVIELLRIVKFGANQGVIDVSLDAYGFEFVISNFERIFFRVSDIHQKLECFDVKHFLLAMHSVYVDLLLLNCLLQKGSSTVCDLTVCPVSFDPEYVIRCGE